MMELIFATNNQHKVQEINASVPAGYSIISLKGKGILIDIPEPYNTLEENAQEKARTIYKLTGTNCFSEDTGLGVTALNGEPGVKSARYAGEEKSDQENIIKLLHHLNTMNNREAQFKTVICLIFKNKEYLFDGVCEGTITSEQKGNRGFGYDSIFTPTGSDKTFAQMTLTEKNVFSHRRKAVDKLVAFLNNSAVNKQY